MSPTFFSFPYFSRLHPRREHTFSLILAGALIAFELFNFGTTEFALMDLLGDLDFIGIRWATILALAFCGMDFAGLGRLFSPQAFHKADHAVGYLFGAWLLAAGMDALLTWWGVIVAILQHESMGNALVSREVLLNVVPVFVAGLVCVLRALLVGSFSKSAERSFGMSEETGKTENLASYCMPDADRGVVLRRIKRRSQLVPQSGAGTSAGQAARSGKLPQKPEREINPIPLPDLVYEPFPEQS